MADAISVVECPGCSAKLKLKGDIQGKKIKCPKCSKAFRIGGGASASARRSSEAADQQPASRSRRAPEQQASQRSTPRPASRRAAATEAGSPAAAPSRPRKKKRRRPEPEPEYAESYDDPYGLDDYGDDFGGDGLDDYGDHNAPALPTRRKKKKKKTSASTSEGGSFVNVLQSLGFVGWILAGMMGGLLGIFLTTLVGYSGIAMLIAAMSVVTGSLVGGAIRLAAGHAQGWGPGLIGGAIAIVAIFLGKVGAFYVAPDGLLGAIWGGDDMGDVDLVAEATEESALIARIADEVHEEWLDSGELTEQRVDAYWENQFNNFQDDDFEDFDEDAPYDYSEDHLPEVWEEATRRWQAKSEEERQAFTDEVIAEAQLEQEAFDEAEQVFSLGFAVFFAVWYCLVPISPLLLFCSGVFSAFRLASNLGTDE